MMRELAGVWMMASVAMSEALESPVTTPTVDTPAAAAFSSALYAQEASIYQRRRRSGRYEMV